jgi:hypothetical protein
MDDKQAETKQDKTDWALRVTKWAAVFLWYAIGLFLVLTIIEGLEFGEEDHPARLFKVILGLIVLASFFVLIHFGVRTAGSIFKPSDAVRPPTRPGDEAFPSRITIWVGIWLLIISAVSVIGLLLSLNPPDWLTGIWSGLSDSTTDIVISNVLITMFAAGVGSCITTIMGFLQHASEDKNFELAYAPWYVARPVMGILLGLVFYVVVVGGLMSANIVSGGSDDTTIWTLAGVGALVGLFSKNAIEKLREVFNTMFRTQKDMENELLTRMRDELKEKIKPYLSGEKPEKPETDE